MLSESFHSEAVYVYGGFLQPETVNFALVIRMQVYSFDVYRDIRLKSVCVYGFSGCVSLQQLRNKSVIQSVNFNMSGSFSGDESAYRVEQVYSVPAASADISREILVKGSSSVMVCA